MRKVKQEVEERVGEEVMQMEEMVDRVEQMKEEVA